MRTRLRLGAVSAIALGALLLATVLASPALAWHSKVSVEAECVDDGSVRVGFTVTAWEEGHEGTADVFYVLNGEETELLSDEPLGEEGLSGEFELPAGTTGELTLIAVVHWDSGEKSTDKASTELPKCEEETTTSTAAETTAPPTTAPPTTAPPTTAPPTTAPPTTAPPTTAAPTTSLETTTTEAVAGIPTTTSGGGQLPFTGAGSSGPMLLAGIALVAGGALFLLISRIRERHTS
jgi:hypothetical protein